MIFIKYRNIILFVNFIILYYNIMCDCNSNTCCTGFTSRATLAGTFTRNDGIVFTATMTATGTGNTCDSARADCEVNINNTLQNFLSSYTPKIVSYTYDVNYVTTCDTHLCPSPKQKSIVQNYLNKSIADSKALFAACTFGNAFTGNEIFIGSGNGGPNGEPIDPSMYWRWASMTKLVGLLSLAAALEDGIITSLDTPIWEYIPEVANITTYVSDSSANTGTDAFGTPLYSQILTTEPNLGKSITIRMCLQSSSGFGYTFWGIGSARNTFVNGLSGTKSGQNYIAWLQNIEKNNGYADNLTATYDNQHVTFTDTIISRTNYPLLCKPGTTNIYDTGFTFISGVIGGALQKKGYNQTAAEYVQTRIFEPVGMKNCWFCCGSLNPPSDVLSKLTNAYFARKDTGSSISGSYQKGSNVLYNTIYGAFDPSANGDGFKNQELNMYIQQKADNYLLTDKYAGGFASGGCGTLSDFCKLLKLIINKGYNHENQTLILTEQSIEWILAAKYSPTRRALGLNAPNAGLIDILNPNATWCGGTSKYMENTDTLPFGTGPHTYTWGGYFGSTFIFDIETGNYLVSGTQVSAASWQTTTATSPFQPDANFIWKTLTCNFK
jgi:CubicO group peptidase (beta-lactamase class C family)